MKHKLPLLTCICFFLFSCSFFGSAWHKTKNFYKKLVYTKRLPLKKLKIPKTEEQFAYTFSSLDEEIEQLLFEINLLNRKSVLNKLYIDKIKNRYVWVSGYVVFDTQGKILQSYPKDVHINTNKFLKLSEKHKDIFLYIKGNEEPKVFIMKPFFYNRKLIYILAIDFNFSALASFYPESKNLLILGSNQIVLWKGQNIKIMDDYLKRKDLKILTPKKIKGIIKIDKKDFFYFVRYIGEGKIIYCMVITPNKKGG